MLPFLNRLYLIHSSMGNVCLKAEGSTDAQNKICKYKSDAVIMKKKNVREPRLNRIDDCERDTYRQQNHPGYKP